MNSERIYIPSESTIGSKLSSRIDLGTESNYDFKTSFSKEIKTVLSSVNSTQ